MGLEARFHVWTDRNVNRERMMVRTECSRRRNHGVKNGARHDSSLKRKNLIDVDIMFYDNIIKKKINLLYTI